MSEDDGIVPTPLILDASVLIEIARGDTDIMTLIQDYDAAGQPMVVPALAVTAASIDIHNEEAADLLGGLELFENIEIAPLQGVEQALALAAVMARTGLEPWDAHVAAIADAAVCPILTLDAAKWRQHSEDLDDHLYIVEIADPDEEGRRGGQVGDHHPDGGGARPDIPDVRQPP